MKMPDPVPLDGPRIIAETIERLKSEAVDLGYRQKLATEFTEQFIKDAEEAKKELGDLTTAWAGVTAGRLSRLRIDLRIELAVNRRILEVLLTHLKEDSHREAVKALKGIRLQDII